MSTLFEDLNQGLLEAIQYEKEQETMDNTNIKIIQYTVEEE